MVILEHKNMKSITVSTFPQSTCHEVMGLDAMTLAFWMLSFKPAFSFFFLIQKLIYWILGIILYTFLHLYTFLIFFSDFFFFLFFL